MGLSKKVIGTIGIAGLALGAYLGLSDSKAEAGGDVRDRIPFLAAPGVDEMWTKADKDSNLVVSEAELSDMLKDIGYDGAPIPPSPPVALKVGAN